MKLFAPDFSRHAGRLLMVTLLFLIVFAFDIQAQDVRGPSARDERLSLEIRKAAT